MKRILNTEIGKAGIALLVCLVAFFVHNQVIVPDIMESRNLVAAREMADTGHWLIPTMNGELRLEKPPLPTWLAAVAERVSPDDLGLQRGLAGMAALLLVGYFGLFARRVLRTDPLVPVLLFCTCYQVVLMGRTASWDIYCHAFMMGGIYHLARAFRAPPPAWGHCLAAGVCTGLSVLSKGPVSLYALFLPFLAAYGLVYRPSLRGKGRALVLAAAVAVIVGLWWYVYVYLMQADALSAVVQKESGAWANRNVRPWWYYWKFFLETGVWSLLLLTALFLPAADGRRRRSRRWLFAVGWMLASLVLLSLMPEKKSRYLFPLLVPACYAMGCLVTGWINTVRERSCLPAADRWCFRANAGLIAAVVAVLPVAAWWFLLRPGYVPTGFWVACSLFAAAVTLFLVRAAVRLRPMDLLGGVALLFAAAECFVMPVLGNIINNPDMKSIAETRRMRELEGVPFLHLDTVPLRIELVYAARRVIRPVSPDSLQRHLPCVLLTHRPAGETLSEKQRRKMEIIPIGCYDDNRRPRSNRRYSREFIYCAALLKAKDGPEDSPTENEQNRNNNE